MDEETLPDSGQAGSSFLKPSGKPAPRNEVLAATTPGSMGVGPAGDGQDLTGQMLGDYLLTRKIARGGMGEVYEAMQMRLDRKVALKVLSPHLAEQPLFIQRFEREAKAAAALNHPGIVQVYDFGQANGRYYLIMEYVDGSDLADYLIEHGKLSISEGLAVVEQAAQALKAAYELSIIHRDVKPANLMLTKDGRVKVSDLGLAKRLTEDTEMTATGVGIGSPLFLSPEQAEDARHVDHRADIYSLGITLLYLLTGKAPFQGTSAYSVVLAHASKPLPSGAELGTELPENIEQLVGRMAAKRPEDRYQSYDELLEDLERVKAGYPPVKAIGSDENRGFANPLLAGFGVGLVLVGLMMAGWFYFLRKPAPAASPAVPAVTPNPQAQTELPGDSTARPPVPNMPRRNGPPGNNRPLAGLRERPAGPNGAGGRAGTMPSLNGDVLLTVTELPNFNSLKDGPITDMIAEAKQYIAENKTNYTKIIDRYQQLSRKASGTEYQAQVQRSLSNWILIHSLESSDAIDKYTAHMKALLQQGKTQEAWDVWKSFPTNLRNREVDNQIAAIVKPYFPDAENTQQ